ncbi:hypothetical protein RCL1_008427 [Eukaryota sp. TZLM3-RCL]
MRTHVSSFVQRNSLNEAVRAESFIISMSTTAPLKIDTLSIPLSSSSSIVIGLTELPGCNRTNYSRCLTSDLEVVKSHNYTKAFIFLEKRELLSYCVPNLLDCYRDIGVTPILFELEDGYAPSFELFRSILTLFRQNLEQKILFHCQGGLGRTGTIVIGFLLVFSNFTMSVEDAVKYLKNARPLAGPRTANQLKFLYELHKHITL